MRRTSTSSSKSAGHLPSSPFEQVAECTGAELSWNQAEPVTSLRLLEQLPLRGESTLVDALLARSHRDLTVLDVDVGPAHATQTANATTKAQLHDLSRCRPRAEAHQSTVRGSVRNSGPRLNPYPSGRLGRRVRNVQDVRHWR